MRLIMLDHFLGAEVVHADCLLLSAGKHTLICRVKFSMGDRSIKAVIFLDWFSLFDVPNH